MTSQAHKTAKLMESMISKSSSNGKHHAMNIKKEGGSGGDNGKSPKGKRGMMGTGSQGMVKSQDNKETLS